MTSALQLDNNTFQTTELVILGQDCINHFGNPTPFAPRADVATMFHVGRICCMSILSSCSTNLENAREKVRDSVSRKLIP